MKITTVNIDTLTPDPNNARRHDERNIAAIRDSLARFGQQKPLVVDKDGVVVAGSGTLESAKQLGWKKIKIVRSSLSGASRTAYAVADNRTAELATWEDEMLAQSLAEVRADEGIDELATGFSDREIEALLARKDDGDGDDGRQKTIGESFTVMVECADESEQRAVFEEMKGKGFKCRVLTM